MPESQQEEFEYQCNKVPHRPPVSLLQYGLMATCSSSFPFPSSASLLPPRCNVPAEVLKQRQNGNSPVLLSRRQCSAQAEPGRVVNGTLRRVIGVRRAEGAASLCIICSSPLLALPCLSLLLSFWGAKKVVCPAIEN